MSTTLPGRRSFSVVSERKPRSAASLATTGSCWSRPTPTVASGWVRPSSTTCRWSTTASATASSSSTAALKTSASARPFRKRSARNSCWSTCCTTSTGWWRTPKCVPAYAGPRPRDRPQAAGQGGRRLRFRARPQPVGPGACGRRRPRRGMRHRLQHPLGPIPQRPAVADRARAPLVVFTRSPPMARSREDRRRRPGWRRL
jgi:hypothetical protein